MIMYIARTALDDRIILDGYIQEVLTGFRIELRQESLKKSEGIHNFGVGI